MTGSHIMRGFYEIPKSGGTLLRVRDIMQVGPVRMVGIPASGIRDAGEVHYYCFDLVTVAGTTHTISGQVAKGDREVIIERLNLLNLMSEEEEMIMEDGS